MVKINKNKKVIIGILITLIIVIGTAVVYKIIGKSVTDRANFNFEIQNISPAPIDTESNEISWEEITVDGVNEELLLKNINTELLTQIATELQTLVEEATEEERKNPEIVITEGWTRIFEYERYKKVLNIGTPAMKPLYLILYKSPYAGEYEYLCAKILYQLSGFNFEWANSREFLEGFNQKIIESRQ